MSRKFKKRPRCLGPQRPLLYIGQILAWADEHFQRTGKWPTRKSGWIPGTLDEKWINVDAGLRVGKRSLRPGSSLARLLAEHRGVRNEQNLPRLSVKTILAWADAHHERTGRWPNEDSGPIEGAPGETWCAIDNALRHQRRGIRQRSSLPRLLAKHRGVPNRSDLPSLTHRRILQWADEQHRRTGSWPMRTSGAVHGIAGETWSAVAAALWFGTRGLPGGSSLAMLLAEHRNVRYNRNLPKLRVNDILRWADAHRSRAGHWPGKQSGPIAEAPGETWSAVDAALIIGRRNLPGGSSLATLLALHRGVRNKADLPELKVKDIVRWANAHRRRTGRWPAVKAGPIPEASGETWAAVDDALRRGGRGLAGGLSLARILA
jgi:hypothetical protein